MELDSSRQSLMQADPISMIAESKPAQQSHGHPLAKLDLMLDAAEQVEQYL